MEHVWTDLVSESCTWRWHVGNAFSYVDDQSEMDVLVLMLDLVLMLGRLELVALEKGAEDAYTGCMYGREELDCIVQGSVRSRRVIWRHTGHCLIWNWHIVAECCRWASGFVCAVELPPLAFCEADIPRNATEDDVKRYMP